MVNIIWVFAFLVHGVVVHKVGFNIPEWEAWALILSGGVLYITGLCQGLMR